MSNVSFDVAQALAAVRGRCVALGGQEWPGLGTIVDVALPDPLDPVALLSIATGRAAGAALADLEPVAAALILVNLALRIMDDCADQDNPDALYEFVGLGRAIHAAAALNAIGAREFSRRHLLDDEPLGSYYRSFLQVCQGQDRDLDERVGSLADYEKIVRLKTVAAYEFAAVVGARAASADPDTIAHCSQCGIHLGWMIQILDDVEALWFPELERSSENERLTFPVLWGLASDHPNARLLRELYQTKEYGRVRVCMLLDEMDVRARLISLALDHRDTAIAALRGLSNSEGTAILELWLDWLLRDGARLLETAPYTG